MFLQKRRKKTGGGSHPWHNKGVGVEKTSRHSAKGGKKGTPARLRGTREENVQTEGGAVRARRQGLNPRLQRCCASARREKEEPLHMHPGKGKTGRHVRPSRQGKIPWKRKKKKPLRRKKEGTDFCLQRNDGEKAPLSGGGKPRVKKKDARAKQRVPKSGGKKGGKGRGAGSKS